MRKVMFACAVIVGCTSVATASESGIASYYQNPHYSGLIAAHKTLPLGSRVKVLNLDNGRSATLKIVDRGPFIRGRVIDVSPAAASALGFRQAGLAHVRIERN
jgi:rare lipoprotein A